MIFEMFLCTNAPKPMQFDFHFGSPRLSNSSMTIPFCSHNRAMILRLIFHPQDGDGENDDKDNIDIVAAYIASVMSSNMIP